MIQSHLLQLLCVIAMECPKEYDAEFIRDAKTKVMKSVKMLTPDLVFKNVIRGQYTAGDIDGLPRPAHEELPAELERCPELLQRVDQPARNRLRQHAVTDV